jgi:hypothetical protein
MTLNRIQPLLTSLALVLGASRGHCQGTFRNLDFEGATPPFVPSLNGVYSSNAIPGWTPYFGDAPADEVIYNDIGLGGATVSLHSLRSPFFHPLQGIYNVLLQGASAGPQPRDSAAIGQTGVIPQDAQSLLFFFSPGSAVQVTFGGQPVSTVLVGSRSDCLILGAKISAFAGQSGELRFTVPPGNGALIDNIQFSTLPIPEPSIFVLSALGAAALAFRTCRERLRKPAPSTEPGFGSPRAAGQCPSGEQE